MNTKAAFTMVELIFVIVILGILAAVAVPRLNASREDAKVAKLVADMRTLWSDVHSYYLANGETSISTKLSDVTNVVFSHDTNFTVFYDMDEKFCLSVSLGYGDNCLVISYYDDGASPSCQKAVEQMDFIRGHSRYLAENYSYPCVEKVRNSEVVRLIDSKKDGWRGVAVFLDESNIEQ